MQENEFRAACLQKFKSRALCVTRTQPFYIWQKIEIERLRKSIIRTSATIGGTSVREIRGTQSGAQLGDKIIPTELTLSTM